jgi:hypothetical protein
MDFEAVAIMQRDHSSEQEHCRMVMNVGREIADFDLFRSSRGRRDGRPLRPAKARGNAPSSERIRWRAGASSSANMPQGETACVPVPSSGKRSR